MEHENERKAQRINDKLTTAQHRLIDIEMEYGLCKSTLTHEKNAGGDGSALVTRMNQLFYMNGAIQKQVDKLMKDLDALGSKS